MKKFIFFLLLVFPTSLSALTPDAYVDDDWSGLAAGVDPDGSGPATQIGTDAFASLAEAIPEVAADGTIHLAEGFYTEQVVIDHNLTLVGAGTNTIIQAPATLSEMFNTGVSNKPIVFVQNTSHVEIRNLTVDGFSLGNSNYRFMGIGFLNASGIIDHTEVRFIENSPMDGAQHGVAIYVRTTLPTDQTITITNNNIHDYQKNGMAIVGDHLVATITDNSVTGSGQTPLIAQNGIQLSYGASGTIARNTISGNYCTSIPGHCADDPTSITSDSAAGILIFAPGNDPVDIHDNILTDNQNNISLLSSTAYFSTATQLLANIYGNTIDGGQLGIAIYDLDGSLPIIGNIFQNIITDQEYGLFVSDFAPGDPAPNVAAHQNQIFSNSLFGAWGNTTVNAQRNWWGCPTGSLTTTGPCDIHSDLVDVSDHLPSSDISGSGGSSGSGGTAEATGGITAEGSGGSVVATGGSTESAGASGTIGEPSGESAGISGDAGAQETGGSTETASGGTDGDSGLGGDTGTTTGTETNFDASGCSCRLQKENL